MFQHRVALTVVLAAVMRAAAAQNLIDNPSFDADTSGWTTSTFSTWNNAIDHDDGGGGVLQISTLNFDSASQCLVAGASQRYIFSAWTEINPLREFDPCSNPSRNFHIEWFDDLECQDTSLLQVFTLIPNPMPQGWIQENYTETAPQTAHSVRVTLQAACGRQDGTSTFYFDDIVFMPDSIFKNDFEVHAGDIDPKSGL